MLQIYTHTHPQKLFFFTKTFMLLFIKKSFMLQPKHPVNVQGTYKCKYIKSSTGNIEINDVDFKHFCAYIFFMCFTLTIFNMQKEE